MADLYVYFYELGVRLLKPGGLLSFIVTNKWMKAGCGEQLRRFFSEKAWVRSVVDFGHANQITGLDTFAVPDMTRAGMSASERQFSLTSAASTREHGKRGQDLMAFCHNVRKGRNTGSHRFKRVAPPLHSTSFSDFGDCDMSGPLLDPPKEVRVSF